jgi:ppGpp synthetase/RelA/SpoT-type nucleotidyltranferase
MKMIDEFIKQYNKEYDYYQKLSQIVAGKIEDQLFNRGIKAIVSFRAKKPDRLYDKLVKRNESKRYKNIQEIYDDIVDLSGVRISLYFPSERELLDEIINDIFEVKVKKIFPNETHKPKHEKRFSGYWATHYRVNLKENSAITNRYIDATTEIQVASVLMHAWSEVEHDLVYKPYSGDLSKEELAILDEINGLVLSGEIALERLQSAMAERTEKSNKIDDKYELTNYIYNRFKNNDKIKLGNTYLINNLIKSNKDLDIKTLNEYLKLINLENIDDTISNQLFDIYISNNKSIDERSIKNYIKNLNLSTSKATNFESFINGWKLLNEASNHFVNEVNEKNNLINPSTKFKLLLEHNIINSNEYDELSRLRQIRNDMVHKFNVPNYLNSDFKSVLDLTEKIIDKIDVKALKDRLKAELKKLQL